MTMIKSLAAAAIVLSCSSGWAKPHHAGHHKPHVKVCRVCDGRGKVRSWCKMWLGWHACHACHGKGSFVAVPPPPRHGPKHPPKVEKHRPVQPVHARPDHGKKPKKR